jgi:hypothetical protein
MIFRPPQTIRVDLERQLRGPLPRLPFQTLALTLAPIALKEWIPPLCTLCNRLPRKFCNEACEAAAEAPASATVALPCAP